MTATAHPDLDLTISRIMKAPRSAVWSAWSEATSLEQWWLPAPLRCRVVALDLEPGGTFETQMSEDGRDFVPHLRACVLDVREGERIVFTNVLTGGWRPADVAAASELPLITAIITMRDHPQGTDYSAHVMHASPSSRGQHERLGFHEGWGTVTEQLAALAERRA